MCPEPWRVVNDPKSFQRTWSGVLLRMTDVKTKDRRQRCHRACGQLRPDHRSGAAWNDWTVGQWTRLAGRDPLWIRNKRLFFLSATKSAILCNVIRCHPSTNPILINHRIILCKSCITTTYNNYISKSILIYIVHLYNVIIYSYLNKQKFHCLVYLVSGFQNCLWTPDQTSCLHRHSVATWASLQPVPFGPP